MGDIWSEIRRQQEDPELLRSSVLSEADLLDASGDEPEFDDGYEYDEYVSETDEEDYEAQLISAQQQWEESLEQLSQVLNWILLPLVGKYLGRRTALRVWKSVMEYFW